MDTDTCFEAAGLAEETMNKRGLQIAMAILGIIPIATGIVGLFGLSDPIFANSGLPANPILDSNLRFFAGIWLGLGIALSG